jgi:cyclopropane fatty-acyl-phospholipid synthase-like methyltransferase
MELGINLVFQMIKKIRKKLYKIYTNAKFTTSEEYWEERYTSGGNSGAGSYGKFSLFKAEIINDFIKNNKIKTVLEFGCGDGNQLSLLNTENYIGLDVSKTVIQKCIKKFNKDEHKSFFIYEPYCFLDKNKIFFCDLTLSLDVLFHLIEQDIFEKYLTDLFSSSKKYVIIYSSNYNSSQTGHEKRRNFTDWIEKNAKNFKLIEKIPNKYPPYDGKNPDETCSSDFYIYRLEKI